MLGREFAGFWRRVLASMIDGFIFLGLVILVGFLIGFDDEKVAFLEGITAVMYWWYMVLMTASPLRGTLGKLILDIAIVDTDGQQISILRSIAREIAKILSALLFGIGYIMVAFTPEKRGLHDYIAGTLPGRAGDWEKTEPVKQSLPQKGLGYAALFVVSIFVYGANTLSTDLTEGYGDLPGFGDIGSETDGEDAASADDVRSDGQLADDSSTSIAGTNSSEEFAALAMVMDHAETHAVEKQAFPSSFQDLGLSRADTQELGLSEVKVNPNGVISVRYDASSDVGVALVVMAPYVNDDGHILWNCRSPQVDDKNLPEHCKP